MRYSYMLRIERLPKRTFVLYGEGKELGRLVYRKWWSEKAEILLPGGFYELAGKSFWSLALTARYQGMPIMHITFSWKGGGKIQRVGRPDRDLTYSSISFWRTRYKVMDALGRERMSIRSKYNWKHFDPDHAIEGMLEPHLDPLEILMVIHAINISHRRSAAAAAG